MNTNPAPNGDVVSPVKIPAKLSGVMKNWLGIDADEIVKQFVDASNMFRSFCIHFDKRMVTVAGELEKLRHEIEALKQVKINDERESTIGNERGDGRDLSGTA